MWRISMKAPFTALIVVCLLGVFAYGQVDGIPNFSVADAHESDTVSLTTLVPTINVPVLTKAEPIRFSTTFTSSQACSVSGTGIGSNILCNNGDFSLFSLGLTGSSIFY